MNIKLIPSLTLVSLLLGCANTPIENKESKTQFYTVKKETPKALTSIPDKKQSKANLAGEQVKILSNSDTQMNLSVSTRYYMGDADSKISARKLALEQAKVIASETFGTAVEHELELHNQSITKDRIRTYSISHLKANIEDEESAFEGNRQYLWLSVNVKVEKTKLLNNIDLVAHSSHIKELTENNRRLRQQLEELNSQIVGGNIDEKGARYLVQQREDVLMKLDENIGHVRKSIDKQDLKQSLTKINSEWEYHKNRIEEGIYEYIAQTNKVSISKPRIVSEANGTVKIELDYRYDFSPKPLVNIYKEYFRDFNVYSTAKGVDHNFDNLYKKYRNAPYANKLKIYQVIINA